jgi:hypothetical protein
MLELDLTDGVFLNSAGEFILDSVSICAQCWNF